MILLKNGKASIQDRSLAEMNCNLVDQGQKTPNRARVSAITFYSGTLTVSSSLVFAVLSLPQKKLFGEEIFRKSLAAIGHQVRSINFKFPVKMEIFAHTKKETDEPPHKTPFR